MITKNELRHKLRAQFGVYINSEEYEIAFEQTLILLDRIQIENDQDIFQLFIHHIISHIIDRIKVLEDNIT